MAKSQKVDDRRPDLSDVKGQTVAEIVVKAARFARPVEVALLAVGAQSISGSHVNEDDDQQPAFSRGRAHAEDARQRRHEHGCNAWSVPESRLRCARIDRCRMVRLTMAADGPEARGE